jgi:galactose-6-phosphate isomerase
MPLLDVTEVINEPLFTDPAIWLQRDVVIGQDGIAVITETASPIQVIPTAGDGSTRERDKDGAIVHHRQRFYTTAPLNAGTAGRDSDRVIWRGRTYLVDSVGDWSVWGAGFVSAACQLVPLDGGTIAEASDGT